jgi:predicted TIM-barrel fold metal-dependent hydrolase
MKELGHIDCHVHMYPKNSSNLGSFQLYMSGMRDLERARRAQENPKFFIQILDEANVEKAFIIPVVSPKVGGFPFKINNFVADYCAKYPDRLIPFGSIDPRQTKNPKKELRYLLGELGVRGIKIHPCHQLVYPNEYRTTKLKSLETLYSIAEEKNVPIMIHTGTSLFPDARNIFGDPLYVDDVAVDFPYPKIILAHGGRPLWTQTAFFLVRRHKNVYMDISSIPPKRLLEYFPRLELIAEKTMFGSDWPDPAVPGIKENLASFSDLTLPASAKHQILRETAMRVIGK